MGWLDLLADQGTLRSLFQHHCYTHLKADRREYTNVFSYGSGGQKPEVSFTGPKSRCWPDWLLPEALGENLPPVFIFRFNDFLSSLAVVLPLSSQHIPLASSFVLTSLSFTFTLLPTSFFFFNFHCSKRQIQKDIAMIFFFTKFICIWRILYSVVLVSAICQRENVSHLVMSNSLQPHGL